MTAREWPCRTTLCHTVNQGEPCREWLVMHEKPPPPPRRPKTHSPIHLLALPCIRAVAPCFVLLTRSTPFRALLFLSFLAACGREHPLLSTPLLCCGERAKARKAHTGSLECLQAVREMISAVKRSLFQGRVNSLFILAFTARHN